MQFLFDIHITKKKKKNQNKKWKSSDCQAPLARSYFPGGEGHLYLKLDIILVKKFT